MEEDIKVLEELIEDYHLNREIVCVKDIQAIENLIKRNKELEEENRALREDYQTENQYYEKEIKELLEDVDKTPFINKHLKGQYLYDNLKMLLQEGDDK